MKDLKSVWIYWIEPEVGLPVMECSDCGEYLATLEPPSVCPRCQRKKDGIVRGEEEEG